MLNFPFEIYLRLSFIDRTPNVIMSCNDKVYQLPDVPRYQICLGEDFKRLTQGVEFCMFHHRDDEYYVTGLNFDKTSHIELVGPRSLGFIDTRHSWFQFKFDLLRVRKVTIPDDARIYGCAFWFKADKLILSEAMETTS